MRAETERERYRLLEAIRSALAAIADAVPVVLVVDDLHWAAEPTIVMLRHVLWATDARLLVVGTYRDTDLSRLDPLADALADFPREVGVELGALGGLVDGDVVAIMEAAAGHALADDGCDLAAAVCAETEGNPFFVGEVLGHLAETGAVTREAGQWRTAGPNSRFGVPQSVSEVVGRRLSRLAGPVQRPRHGWWYP